VVFPALIEAALREMLWFRYPFADASKIADKMMKRRSALQSLFRKGSLRVEQKEIRAMQFFESLRNEVWAQQGIALEPEFGLLFLFTLSIYPENANAWDEDSDEQDLAPRDFNDRHKIFGELFCEAAFYSYNPANGKWDRERHNDLKTVLHSYIDERTTA